MLPKSLICIVPILLALTSSLVASDDSSPTHGSSTTTSTTTRATTTTTRAPSPVSRATHPPWPTRSPEEIAKIYASYSASYGSSDILSGASATGSSSTRRPDVSRATHAPWPTASPYDYLADHTRATHAPYPPPSRKKSPESGTKRPLIKIDTEIVRDWLKETLAYLAAPFFVPTAITKAIKQPPGLNQPGQNLWLKLLSSFKSVLLKRSSTASPEDYGKLLLRDGRLVEILVSRILENLKLLQKLCHTAAKSHRNA